MNLFEFSIKKYYPKKEIFLELKNYFGDKIYFIDRDDLWDILGNDEVKKNIIGIEISYEEDLDIIDDVHKTYISAASNFDDITMMSGFYKYISKKLDTEVAFNGFLKNTCHLVYLYTENNELYEAKVEINEKGKDIVVPVKILNQ